MNRISPLPISNWPLAVYLRKLWAFALSLLVALGGCQSNPPDQSWPNSKNVTMQVLPETVWEGVPASDPNPPARIPATTVAFRAEDFTHRAVGSDLEIDFQFPQEEQFPVSEGTGLFLPDEKVYLISPSRTHVRLTWKSAPKEILPLLDAIPREVSVSFDRSGRIFGFQPGDDASPTLIETAGFRKVPAGQPKRWNLRVTDYRIFPWPTGKRKHYLTPGLFFPSGIWCYGLYETGKPSSPFEYLRFFVRESPEGIRIRDYGGEGERENEVFSTKTQEFQTLTTVEAYVRARFSEDSLWLLFVSPGRPIAVSDQYELGPGSENTEMVSWVASLPASEDFTQSRPKKSRSREEPISTDSPHRHPEKATPRSSQNNQKAE